MIFSRTQKKNRQRARPPKPTGDPDFVLDCIDDAPTKAELLGYCSDKGLRVIASLGAGLKVRVYGWVGGWLIF
jgi:tRNA A37 threonylcarbamoyladenosine dehydratase